MLTVRRDTFTANSTRGRLFIDGVFECFTLEPRRERMLGKPYAIPSGTYQYSVKFSEHFQRKVICLWVVPGFTSIEVHPGNFPKDTHGCTLVGQIEGTDFVGHSDAAFEALLAKIPESGLITYSMPVEVTA